MALLGFCFRCFSLEWKWSLRSRTRYDLDVVTRKFLALLAMSSLPLWFHYSLRVQCSYFSSLLPVWHFKFGIPLACFPFYDLRLQQPLNGLGFFLLSTYPIEDLDFYLLSDGRGQDRYEMST